MEEIKTGKPNHVIYKQINDNFKEVQLKKDAIEEIQINETPIEIKDHTVNIPLNEYLAELFKNASYNASSSTLSFTKHNDKVLDIKLPMGLKEVQLSEEYNLIFTQSDDSILSVNLSSLKDIYIGDNTTIEVYKEGNDNKIRVKEGVFPTTQLFNQTVDNINTQLNKSIEDIKNLQKNKVDKTIDSEGNEDKVVLTSVLNSTLTTYATNTKLNEEVAKVTAIAQGKSRARVFDTKQALDTWLADPENVATLQIGDDFLIKAENTPDYWWDGTTIIPYESKMPDISNMMTTDTDQTVEGQKDFTKRPTVNNKPVALQEDIKGNVYTDEDKQKLAGIEDGAQVNTVKSVAGKTGNVVLDKTDVGLSNVDNTSDLNKPVSTAQQNALDQKVDKVTGKGLSTNDYTTEEKNKLAGITQDYWKLDGSNYFTKLLTPNSQNITGWRHIVNFTLVAWGGFTLVLSIKSRHSGNGILTIGAADINGAPVSDANIKIRFYGDTVLAMYPDAWKIIYNKQTGIGNLYWRTSDWNSCEIKILSQYVLSNTTLNTYWSEGEWLTEEPIAGDNEIEILPVIYDKEYLPLTGGTITGPLDLSTPPAANDNSTRVPTTSWVNNRVQGIEDQIGMVAESLDIINGEVI